MNDTFDAALPSPYSGNWKQAERLSSEDSPRLTSYQAPGGEAVSFVLKNFRFSGGQSVDTAEYPFDGLWSNEALNEKPQTLNIEGFIRGAEYIKTRNALIEALRVKTDDDAPGFIDFPFWGRFPIVVTEYEVAENTDERGQCAVNLVFKRAGVSPAERENALPDISTAVETAAANLESAAINSFEKQLAGNSDTNTFSQGVTEIKTRLLNAIGRVQAAQTTLDSISNDINSISGLAAQNAQAPGQTARSLYNAAASIAGALAEIKNSAASYFSTSDGKGGAASYPAPAQNNEKNVLMQFLSAGTYTMNITALTVRQENTKKAMENLYRVSAFGAASLILTQMDMSYSKAQGYWKLFQKLEESIDREDPALYAALEETRISVSRLLSAKALSAEKKRYFDIPLPLLYMARYLGCSEEKLRELNRIADSFVIKGNVVYV
jgi:hypothetical protein